MRKLNKSILKAYAGPFLMAFFVVLFILVMQFITMYMDEIFGKDLEPLVLGKLFFFAAARLVVTAMPVAVLVAALMTFGNMGEHYELAAAKSCGISLFQLMKPMIVLAVILAGFSLWFSFRVIPDANLKFFSLLYDVQRKKADIAVKPGYFYWDIDGYVIRVSDKDNESGMLYDVMLYDHTENRGNVDVTIADSATMKMEPGGHRMRMTLFRGSRYQEMKSEAGDKKSKFPMGRTYFDSLIVRFNLSGFDLKRTDERLFSRHQITLRRSDLVFAVDSVSRRDSTTTNKFRDYIEPYNRIDSSLLAPAGAAPIPDTLKDAATKLVAFLPCPGDDLITYYSDKNTIDIVNKALGDARAIKNYSEFIINTKNDDAKSRRLFQIEFQMMHSIPLVCILFMLIGVSLGAIIRKGGLGMPSIVSLVFFVIFYVLMSQGRKLAKEDVISPILGPWLPVIVLTPIAIALSYQATMDAKILDESSRDMLRDRISLFFLKIGKGFKKTAKPQNRKM